jgi:ectoine hydroxylase-related dioxygenase (phytanoyl-CoA dioxygenase family)
LLDDAVVVDFILQDSIAELVTNCLDQEAFLFKATLFDKQAGSNWLVSWHQDVTLPVKHRTASTGWSGWSRKAGVDYAIAPVDVMERVLALRIHLDDCGPDNGPLRVRPGTHRLGRLTCLEPSFREEYSCLARRGDALLMRPLLQHASSKALLATHRRILHLEFANFALIGPEWRDQIFLKPAPRHTTVDRKRPSE